MITRKQIQIGFEVEIVQKQHQRTGMVTRGVVKRLLTKSATHPHGIKVQLESGIVGRVKNVLEADSPIAQNQEDGSEVNAEG